MVEINCSMIYSYCAGCDVWVDQPTTKGLIIYSILVPAMAVIGIIVNVLCLIVLLRKEFSASIYTYLSVLALNDLVASCLLLIAGLSRGVLWSLPRWPQYEAIISISVGGIFNCWCIISMVAVTLDRVVYLWNPTRTTKPKFCRQKVARIVMLVGLLFSIIFNLPYCFMYTWTSEESISVTPFVKSTFFTVHIWTRLVLFGIAPAAFLICGNAFLIRSLRRIRSHFVQIEKCGNYAMHKHNSNREQTFTLVAIVFFFVIVVIPTQLVSRPSAVPILFLGDDEKADQSKVLEVLRQIATLLNTINITVNFIIYYMFCPTFYKAFNRTFRCATRPKNTVQINVFFIAVKDVLRGFNLLDIQMIKMMETS